MLIVLYMITPDQETDGGYEHGGDDRYFKVGSLLLLLAVIGVPLGLGYVRLFPLVVAFLASAGLVGLYVLVAVVLEIR